MATIFVSSVDGSNADSGADWTNAKQTVAGALAIAGTGDVIKVDSAHAFVATAAITWTAPAGSIAIISVNRAGGDAWLAGAAESVGAASAAFSINGGALSSTFIYGMTINGGSNASGSCDIGLLQASATVSSLELVSCTLDMKTAGAADILVGLAAASSARGSRVKATNCTFICSGSRAGTLILLGDIVCDLINPTFSMTGATKPAALFGARSTADMARLTISDGDISGYSVTAGAYFDVAEWVGCTAVVSNCKLSATPTTVTGTWPGGSGYVLLRNCDSADTIYRFEYRNTYGTLLANTSIYAASGASFNSAGVSWQVVTTAACVEGHPFYLPPMSVWNTSTSAQTATVEFVKDGATDLTDREIWLEVSYANSTSFPSSTRGSDRNANPFTAAGVDQPNSATSWTGTGGFANEDKQTVDVAFTAAEVGLLTGRVAVAKASTTLYVDPKLRRA